MSERPPIHKSDDELIQLWQDQKLDGARMTLDEIRESAGRFEKAMRQRNKREYSGCVLAIAGCAMAVFFIPYFLVRVGAGFLMVAAIYIAWALYTRGSAQDVPADAGEASLIGFYKRSLQRQRDLLQNIWRWYLLPPVPGFAVLFIGLWFANSPGNASLTSQQVALAHFMLTLQSVVGFGCVVLIAIFNKRAARKLQAKIDALEGEGRE